MCDIPMNLMKFILNIIQSDLINDTSIYTSNIGCITVGKKLLITQMLQIYLRIHLMVLYRLCQEFINFKINVFLYDALIRATSEGQMYVTRIHVDYFWVRVKLCMWFFFSFFLIYWYSWMCELAEKAHIVQYFTTSTCRHLIRIISKPGWQFQCMQ